MPKCRKSPVAEVIQGRPAGQGELAVSRKETRAGSLEHGRSKGNPIARSNYKATADIFSCSYLWIVYSSEGDIIISNND